VRLDPTSIHFVNTLFLFYKSSCEFHCQSLIPALHASGSIRDRILFQNMRQFLAAGAVFAASIYGVAGSTSQELCAGSSQEIGGNYYCKAVSAIQYTSVGFTGSYNEVTMMDPTSGQCTSNPRGFSGQLAPLCDEVCALGILLGEEMYHR
jgi:hypothetical protein